MPEEETLRALDDLVRAGKVLYIGCSNYAAYRLMDSLWLSQHAATWRAFVTLQAQYSLLVRDLEREHVPLCRDEGLGILPWSPLAGGFLTGKFERGKPPPAGTRLGEKAERFARYDLERNWKILDAVRAVASEIGSTPSAVSLAWLLAKPQVTSVIFGARTIEQLDANLAGGGARAARPKQVADARPGVGVRPRLSVRVHPDDAVELVAVRARSGRGGQGEVAQRAPGDRQVAGDEHRQLVELAAVDEAGGERAEAGRLVDDRSRARAARRRASTAASALTCVPRRSCAAASAIGAWMQTMSAASASSSETTRPRASPRRVARRRAEDAHRMSRRRGTTCGARRARARRRRRRVADEAELRGVPTAR